MCGASSVIYRPESKHRKPAEIAADLHLYRTITIVRLIVN